jgi:chloramphenicol-sensitive protein RarD
MPTGSPSSSAAGFWAAISAFAIWGVIPVYWKALEAVPAVQLMAHRLVWCFLLVAGYLAATRGPAWWRPLLAQPGLLRLLAASAVLMALNWWLYIWAVNAGHIVETSLGYFINPLVNVLLGVLVLKERLNPAQAVAVAIAAAGVLYLTLQVGSVPWIALGLAFTFGFYGLIRKLATVDAVPALGLESGVLVLPAAAFLAWAEARGTGAFLHGAAHVDLLVLATGPVTALPLILFAYGVRRIPYSLVGLLQYIAPSLQLACAVWIYHEPFTAAQLHGFACIWLALAIYAGDGMWRWRRAPRAQPVRPQGDRA